MRDKVNLYEYCLMLIFVVVWGEHALLIPNFVMEHNINKLQKNQQGSELTKTMHSPGLYS